MAKNTEPTFVEWSCGCKGILIPDDQEKDLVLWACDTSAEDPDPECFCRRPMGDKDFTYLTPLKRDALIQDIARLVGDGYRYRTIRSALGLPKEG